MEKSVLFDFNNFQTLVDRKSKTVPDQSLSVSQIISRFTRGQSLPAFFPSEDDPQELDDDNLMEQEVLDDFERRQLAIEFEEQNVLGPEKPVPGEADEVSSKHPDKAPEVRETSSATSDSNNV